MYCRNCGSYNSDSTEFCTNCGQPLHPPVQDTEKTENPANTVNPESTGFMGGAENPGNPENTGGMNNNFYGNNASPVPPAPPAPPVYQSGAAGQQPGSKSDPYYPILRKYAASKLFFAGMILFAVGIVLSTVAGIISAFNGEIIGGIGDIIEGLPEIIPPGPEQFTGIYAASYMPCAYPPGVVQTDAMLIPTAIINAVLTAVPGIIVLIGLLTIRNDALKSKGTIGSIRTKGFSLVKGVQIYSLVALCIAAAILLPILVFFIVLSASPDIAGDSQLEMIILAVFMAVLLIPIFVLGIIFQAKVIKMLNAFKKFAADGVPYIKPSLFVIVFGFIAAGNSLVGCLELIALSIPLFIASVTSGLAMLFMLITLSQYRSEMLRVSTAQNMQRSALIKSL